MIQRLLIRTWAIAVLSVSAALADELSVLKPEITISTATRSSKRPAICASPNGRLLAFADGNRFTLLDLSTLTKVTSTNIELPANEQYVDAFAIFLSDSKHLFTIFEGDRRTLFHATLTSNPSTRRIPLDCPSYHCVIPNSNSTEVQLTSGTGFVTRLNLADSKTELRRFIEQSALLPFMSVELDSLLALYGSPTRQHLVKWNLSDASVRLENTLTFNGRVEEVAATSLLQVFVVISRTKPGPSRGFQATAFDGFTGESFCAITLGPQIPTAVAVSNDGLAVAIGFEDGTFGLWDLASGQQVVRFQCSTSSILSCGITANYERIYVATGQGDILLFRLPELVKLDLHENVNDTDSWRRLTLSGSANGFREVMRTLSQGPKGVTRIEKQLTSFKDTSNKIENFVEHLNDSEFQIREDAENALHDLGPIFFDYLRKQEIENLPPETQLRIKRLGKAATTRRLSPRLQRAFSILSSVGDSRTSALVDSYALSMNAEPFVSQLRIFTRLAKQNQRDFDDFAK